MGNAASGLAGDFSGGNVTLNGFLPLSYRSPITLKDFSGAGNVDNIGFTIAGGGVGTFMVGDELTDGSLLAAGFSEGGGAVHTIQAGQWLDFDLTANTIGTLAVVGNAGLVGAMEDSNITVTGGLMQAGNRPPLRTPTFVMGQFFYGGLAG